MKSILVIDDEKSIRDMLRAGLTQYGYNFYDAGDGKNGVEVYKRTRPDIVLTDVKMPEMSGLELTRQLKAIEIDSDIVIMTGYGSEELVIEALRSGATNYIKKPISLNELFNILDGIILNRERRRKSEVIKDVVVFEKKKLVIDNEISRIWGIINQMLFNIPNEVSDTNLEGIRLGLYEIILNAIEHGNLGISYEEKSESIQNNRYLDLLESRSMQPDRKQKRVFIDCTIDHMGLSVEIRDQGGGFDFHEFAEPESREEILRAHGRGIFLASLYFDRIEYTEPGNTVTVSKQFQ
ncbi:MAG: response regulator [Spirochaetes bacterium]|nr:response regulator [Spirochaetota bacterium]